MASLPFVIRPIKKILITHKGGFFVELECKDDSGRYFPLELKEGAITCKKWYKRFDNFHLLEKVEFIQFTDDEYEELKNYRTSQIRKEEVELLKGNLLSDGEKAYLRAHPW